MIQVNSIHHNIDNGQCFTRSHVLTPHDAVSLFLIIEGPDESIVSIIEDHMLESISSTEWILGDANHDFTYITEHYNSYITNIEDSDIEHIKMLFGMLSGELLTLSTIGGTQGILIEENGEGTDISVHENTHHLFHSITTGKIPEGSTIYLANTDIYHTLGSEVLDELSSLSGFDWAETGKNIIEREVHTNTYLIRISRKKAQDGKIYTQMRGKQKQIDIVKNKGATFLEYLRSKKVWEKTQGFAGYLSVLENPRYQYIFLLVGISLLFILGYSLVTSILGVMNKNEPVTKNLLIQAQGLITEAEKLTGNTKAFNTKIGEAEKILGGLKKEDIHTVETQDLLSRIATIKKKVYDIQSIDMSHLPSILPMNVSEIQPVGVLEKNKRLTILGEKGAILDYILGDTKTKIIPYPGGEVLKSFDAGEDGSLYILTSQNHIISSRRDSFAYVNVTGQNSWETSSDIKTFNGNIYLLSEEKNQIFRHKPGINGFSQKANVFLKEIAGITKLSVDGGIYAYMADGKIWRYISGWEEPKSITLNKIPGEWSLENSTNTTFITKNNLSYIYVLNNKKIWIFQPNSKRFQDITAWNYISQFELKTEESVKSIYIPRDGMIYVTTNNGIYELQFESIDGKIIFK